MRNYLLYLFFVIAPFFAMAQQAEDNAIAGRNAIFIYHGYEPASPQFPDSKGNTGYILQRKDQDSGAQWATVSTFHSPQNAGELFANYQAALKVFPDNTNRFDAAEAWGKWKKYRSFDSLRTEIAFAPGQMAFGIVLMDTTVKKGKNYQYRLLRDKQVEADANNITNWVAFPAKINTPKPKFLNRRTERDGVVLQWYIKPGFSTGGFDVYRANGSDNKFQLTHLPTIAAQRNDSLVYVVQDSKISPSEAYRYFIAPTNSFGGGGNIHSDTVDATAMDPLKLLAPQYIHAVANAKRHAIDLHYLLPNSGFIGSVHIMRSLGYDSGFYEIGIVGPADTVFTDSRIIPGKKYYYYLLMTDKMGRNSARSIKTFGLYQDNVNTFPARFVTAEKTKGGVRVSWQNAPDTSVISGYYIYRRIGMAGKFERISQLLPAAAVNAYVDSSKTLVPATLYGYSVVSESLSNAVSSNSNIAYVTPGEAAAQPVKWITPKNVKAIADGNSIRLLWYDMRLLNKGQSYYNIYRKSDQDTVLKEIGKNYPASFASYADSTTVAGVNYFYAIQAADESGHTSAQAFTNSVSIAALPVKAANITAFSSHKNIVLTWETTADSRITRYKIYRYERGHAAENIGQADAVLRKFEDNKAAAGKTYYYYLLPDVANTAVNALGSNKVYASLKP